MSDSVTVLGEAVTPDLDGRVKNVPREAVSGLLCCRETFKIMEKELF